MQKVAILALVSLFFCCTKTVEKKPVEHATQEHFHIQGTIQNFDTFQAYLHTLKNDTYQKTDSCLIKNNTFSFFGKTQQPQRAIISLEKKYGSIPFVLSNDSIQIDITTRQLDDALVKGSKYIEEYKSVQEKSKEIYTEVDYLYPQFQKARLENNLKKLTEISANIKSIEAKNQDYLKQYIKENPQSIVSGILLFDMIKKDTVLNTENERLFLELHEAIKNSNEGKFIAKKLTELKN